MGHSQQEGCNFMANTSHERYNVALSLMLCAGLCICLAMVLLLSIARHYRLC
jgi:hypothetical protein